jgi:octaprenyl-diphosphate synthase
MEVGRLLGDFDRCGGKMLRPGLVLLSGASCGRVTEGHIRLGAIVEIIHNATLLHDDVIDEGQKRRGGPTVNSLWGNERAVLLGDFYLSRALEMCSDFEGEIVRTVAATTVRICEGELKQVFQRGNRQLSESEYIEIITEKSAALFGCCCELGGLLAGGDEGQVGHLADFGLNFGIAFQIVDDLLDIAGDEAKAGKTLGRDVDKNKLTLAVIHLLRTADASGRRRARRELEGRGCNKKALAKLLRSSGSLEYAHRRAEEFIAKAIASLADLQESEAKAALIETARFIGGLGL